MAREESNGEGRGRRVRINRRRGVGGRRVVSVKCNNRGDEEDSKEDGNQGEGKG
jgi:hypothetical protein